MIMAHLVMAYVVTSYIVMAYVVMAYIQVVLLTRMPSTATATRPNSDSVGTLDRWAITIYQHRRRHVRCAGMGMPVLKMTALERRSF